MAWTALATWAALVLYAAVGANVSRARIKYGVEAPAVQGHASFERVFRVHQNTLEQLVLFVPALWLFAWFVSDAWAAALGGVWIAGRALYARTYYADAAKRGPGFALAGLATIVLLIGAVVGIVLALVRA
ncbi:MAG TPA: MAPEG family protein [Gammaproteobacteria bacterium]|nr:MAPEG family protein [Gammaproteobacteria bacterium]